MNDRLRRAPRLYAGGAFLSFRRVYGTRGAITRDKSFDIFFCLLYTTFGTTGYRRDRDGGQCPRRVGHIGTGVPGDLRGNQVDNFNVWRRNKRNVTGNRKHYQKAFQDLHHRSRFGRRDHSVLARHP